MASPSPPRPRSERHTLLVPTGFPAAATPFEKLQHLVSIGGPIGFIPWVPATWASLVTAAVCYAAAAHRPAVVVGTALAFVIGVRTAGVSERLLGLSDPRNVVIDEIAGQALVFALVPALTLWLAAAGFVLFRVFDVLKPPPARNVEALPAGWGIMADDLVAGLFAALGLWILRRWLG